MGWTFTARNGRSVTDMVKLSYNFESDRTSSEIVAHSINVRVGVAYLAVKITLKETGRSFIYGGCALIKLVPRDHYDFGIKEMDESVGPVERDCPKRILDLLTPLEEIAEIDGRPFRPDSWAVQWRADCRANLAKKAARKVLGDGAIITLARPIRFSDGRERQQFRLSRQGRKTRYISVSDNMTCRISKRVLDDAAFG